MYGKNRTINSKTAALYELDDPRFRIRPYQQIASSCTGGILTSLFSK